MFLSYSAVAAYLIATLLLMQFFTKNNPQHRHQKSVFLLISYAVIAHALTFTSFWATSGGVFFGFANSASFIAWVVAILLFLSSISKPVHALGILVYPLVALLLVFNILFPDATPAVKTISLSIASHVFLSITAYALLALAVCQSILLKIQERHLHTNNINGFINKLPPLQTMEALLFQNIRIGFYLLTLSLVTGFIFIDDIFSQHLVHKTVLSLIAWIVFAVLVFGRKVFGWRGKQAIITTQVGFGILLVAYYGSKFVLERLLS
ncbi:MAG: cytochrome C biogenesis protein [Gammaproteobacteria bacterium]|uniref:Cytochrome c assembly protein n=1 Tax=endosymbiont of Bathymodiolus septemdierum str. Myojin knoll TaxID=1303921 RepID=A0A0P0URQ2_9GAMM|nr:cytochrome c biogenesis protein CcsA [Bathymodiolus septemdierum thioautotrophic gill symbiont]RUA06740.1 MAG: cytochrome C biogenesis protein [Gammaproteobacteria bacterium]BAS67798.1 cytochrome c assembly protein [endosymbiont of Bathymodiolus septemdierum str. Myojin knoll]